MRVLPTGRRPAAGPFALVSVLALTALTGCGGDEDADAEPDPSAAPSFTGTPAHVTVTELPSGPVGVAAVDGEPWVVLPEDGAVRTADDELIDVGGTPLRLLAAGDGVWVSDIGRGRLVRIDAGTGRVTRRTTLAPVGSEPRDWRSTVTHSGSSTRPTTGSSRWTRGPGDPAGPARSESAPASRQQARATSGSRTSSADPCPGLRRTAR